MIHICAERLRSIVQQVFEGAGVPPSTAERVAGSLVENNLVGHDSHGVLRVSTYIEAMRSGRADPHGRVSVVRESAATALLDGGWCFGQVAFRQAMDHAMDKARAHDVGLVALRNTYHAGRLGEYAVQAAQAGFIGLVYGSGSVKGGGVAPYLGTSRALNTNPIAWAAPAGKHPPVFLDYATSACAAGKIHAAMDKGERIPEGWLLDSEGDPTTDPHELQRGGALLPFGKHKGYALSFMIEVVTGGLTGVGSGLLPGFMRDYPSMVMAVNIAAFQPLEQFGQMVDDLIEAVKAGRKAPGVDEILVPGEPEWRSREMRLREGLDLPDATWERVVEAGASFGVEITL